MTPPTGPFPERGTPFWLRREGQAPAVDDDLDLEPDAACAVGRALGSPRDAEQGGLSMTAGSGREGRPSDPIVPLVTDDQVRLLGIDDDGPVIRLARRDRRRHADPPIDSGVGGHPRSGQRSSITARPPYR